MAFDREGEHEFAQALENAEEVQVYAKLPRKLQIPTPVGNYVPDWAIFMNAYMYLAMLGNQLFCSIFADYISILSK